MSLSDAIDEVGVLELGVFELGVFELRVFELGVLEIGVENRRIRRPWRSRARGSRARGFRARDSRARDCGWSRSPGRDCGPRRSRARGSRAPGSRVRDSRAPGSSGSGLRTIVPCCPPGTVAPPGAAISVTLTLICAMRIGRPHEHRPRHGRSRRHLHVERRQLLELLERRLSPRRAGWRSSADSCGSPCCCSARRPGSCAECCRAGACCRARRRPAPR